MRTDIGWPLTSNVIRRNSVSNTFGPVRHNPNGTVRVHQGWDFYAPVGTPCYAIADGDVSRIDFGGDYGLVVVLSFTIGSQELFAAYAHLSKSAVKMKDGVTKGQVIGYTGKSGNAAKLKSREDEHLHFEIRDEPRPGKGSHHRMSPAKVFGFCPLKHAYVWSSRPAAKG